MVQLKEAQEIRALNNNLKNLIDQLNDNPGMDMEQAQVFTNQWLLDKGNKLLHGLFVSQLTVKSYKKRKVLQIESYSLH